jgi:5'-3' exonuclease
VDGAEADDVIGTLCQEYGNTNHKILVLSADKDFQQLQTYMNVYQYDPINKKNVRCNNPEQFLLEHIIRGDPGDGIPNIFSDDNTFVIGKRQTPVTQKKINFLSSINLNEATDNVMYRNYMRNKQLIDLTQIPQKIQKDILGSYHSQVDKKSNNLLNYFIANKLRNLTDSIGDFV